MFMQVLFNTGLEADLLPKWENLCFIPGRNTSGIFAGFDGSGHHEGRSFPWID
jgi:hypothetical protein